MKIETMESTMSTAPGKPVRLMAKPKGNMKMFMRITAPALAVTLFIAAPVSAQTTPICAFHGYYQCDGPAGCFEWVPGVLPYIAWENTQHIYTEAQCALLVRISKGLSGNLGYCTPPAGAPEYECPGQ